MIWPPADRQKIDIKVRGQSVCCEMFRNQEGCFKSAGFGQLWEEKAAARKHGSATAHAQRGFKEEQEELVIPRPW